MKLTYTSALVILAMLLTGGASYVSTINRLDFAAKVEELATKAVVNPTLVPTEILHHANDVEQERNRQSKPLLDDSNSSTTSTTVSTSTTLQLLVETKPATPKTTDAPGNPKTNGKGKATTTVVEAARNQLRDPKPVIRSAEQNSYQQDDHNQQRSRR